MRWKQATAEVYGGAIAAYVLATALLFLGRFLPPWQWLLLALVSYGGITLVARRLLARRRAVLWKVFGVEQPLAAEVVAQVLGEKGLPFRRARWQGNVYFLLDDELSLCVQALGSREGLPASRIHIRPLTAETAPLVRSLQEKLDHGFTPRAARTR